MGVALFFLPRNESGVILWPMTGLKNDGLLLLLIITLLPFSQRMGPAQRRVDSPGATCDINKNSHCQSPSYPVSICQNVTQ